MRIWQMKLIHYYYSLFYSLHPTLAHTKFSQILQICRRNEELIKQLSTSAPGSKDLYFPTKYSQPLLTQFKACFWKQHWSYWRNPQYNVIRFFMTTVIGIIFGVIFWGKGGKLWVILLKLELLSFNLLALKVDQLLTKLFFLSAKNNRTFQI